MHFTEHAFLLTRQWQDTPLGVELCYWFFSPQGPIKVIIRQQHAIFFISEQEHPQAQRLLQSFSGWHFRALDLKTFKNEPIFGYYFLSQQQLYQARNCLSQQGLHALESDIRPPDRYLMERFLTGPASINAKQAEQQPQFIEILNPIIKPAIFQPLFKVISLDIETTFRADQIFSIGISDSIRQVVFMICHNAQQTLSEQNSAPSFIHYVKNESQLLQQFIHYVNESDPDIIIGWNVVNFDFRVLEKRAQQLHIALTIGRDHQSISWRQSQRDQHYFLHIPGRIVLDGIETLKNATYKFESYSLEHVASQVLGRGKLIKEDDHSNRADEIARLFNEDKITLAKYNLEDCELVLEIFKKTDLLTFAIERAKLTGLEMDRSGGSVAAFDNLYLPLLHRKGYITPNIEQQPDNEPAPGGYVMTSKPGLYEHVLVFDYKSLYPSIIRTFKVDPYAYVIANQLPEGETIPGFKGITFAKNDTILPVIIEKLWAARDNAKQHKNKSLSQAIKIIMNSFYGVLGTHGCRLHDARLTCSITMRGHEIMKTTKFLIEQQGYEVIYGDTDSVFVWIKNTKDIHQIDETGHRLVAMINQHWQQQLTSQYQVESYLEMEYETHFTRFLMPKLRGSEKGSKKRYAGLITSPIQPDNIIFKGLETVRTDWTPLARNLQQMLYEKIFHDQPYKDYIRTLVKEIGQGQWDQQLVYQKRLGRKLSEYQRNIPPHVQAAIKAEVYFKKHQQPSKYKNGGTIRYLVTVNGPEPLENHPSIIDYQHYIDKQVMPIVDSVVNFLNTSFVKITQRQLEMFD